ncbi:MAG: N-acetyl-gamma-glutamyl-phosphate reductase [Spirochaetes bacterium]|uniref:N-acetyl-gamma-glutamyl-phosphate reductase n=1 Tax=Candidatus Avitreponema avistercoris TaxID=2840705 RepID=A0A9D9HGN8_9SPIR|nr:N-acetyl-gamma-glutamyl-phosphate reductase [Candidatus Avitreponema avistercoris]
MALAKVFIDGQEGTTGLKIRERFAGRDDITLIRIDENERKNPEARAACINASDFTFLCLPDAAAREAVALRTNPATRILDASTAHRTAPDWAYGFPELAPEFRTRIAEAAQVAVPGCYASGFLALCRPLVRAGVLPPDYPVVCHAVSGYSGAGKKAVAQYEDPNRTPDLDAPRQYALTQRHKHLPEMRMIAGLAFDPVFNPYICDFFCGMAVTVPLHTRLLAKSVTAENIREILAAHYDESRFVRCLPFAGENAADDAAGLGGFIAANNLAGTNRMELVVSGNNERVILTARFDNLGKGASGAAVQCLNIMLGIPEDTGLN